MSEQRVKLGHEQQEKNITLADFHDATKKFCLKFKDRHLEEEYREKRIDPLCLLGVFRIFFIIFACLIILRRIEALIFTIYKVTSNVAGVNHEIVNLAFLGGACLLEAIVVSIPKLRFLKGLFFMVYLFFDISYIAYSATRENLNVIAMYFY